MAFPTPASAINDLKSVMSTLATDIGAFHTNAPVPSNQNAALKKLIEQLKGQDAYANAIAQALGALVTSSPNILPDIADERSAALLVRTYLKSTEFMDQLPSPEKLGIDAVPNALNSYIVLKTARENVRAELSKIRDDAIDALQWLIDESGTLANAQVDIDAFIKHLTNAREILHQLKRNNIDLDNDRIGKLIENWQAIIQNLPDPNIAVTGEGRRAAVAQTINVHNLLEAIYDLLAQDVSMENPFDLVSL
jgi:hypothetical protein